jgi:hypothetical protein
MSFIFTQDRLKDMWEGLSRNIQKKGLNRQGGNVAGTVIYISDILREIRLFAQLNKTYLDFFKGTVSPN